MKNIKNAQTENDIIRAMNLHSKLLPRAPNVALMLPMSVKTCRDILQGVLKYASQNGPWAIQFFEGKRSERQLLKTLKSGCAGFIGSIDDAMIRRHLRQSGIPIVLTDTPPATVVIVCDNDQIGRAAAEFFLRRNFRNFAFIGEVHGATWSEERRISFAECLATAGFDLHVYKTPSEALAKNMAMEQHKLAEWLKAMPKPLAAFVANDIRGQQTLNACLHAGVAVPQEVSILSCDNDELICENTTPTLSSIQMTTTEAGYAAAQFLDQLMRSREPVPNESSVVAYGFRNIVSRNSTENLTCSDKLVERAIAYIRLNATKSLTVTKLASLLSVSKRLLELRFRRATGRSPHQEIFRVRLENAMTRLKTSNDTIENIALSCGFSTSSHMSTAFMRNFGVRPSQCRSRPESHRR